MDALLWIAAVGVVLLVVRDYFPAYAKEKGKNLATREDIAAITQEVERVKTAHAAQLKELEHQHSRLIEEIRGKHQLRMAALEKRLEVHQHAFLLWRMLLKRAHEEDIGPLIRECQDWWERNCLYLSAKARDAFNRAYIAARSHREYTRARGPDMAKVVEENWNYITRAGEEIVAGIELPTLGEREASDAAKSG